jgi:hypothetical protein
VIVTIFVTDNVLHAIDKEVVPITKAGSFQYLSRIKEFPLFIYLWHSNAEAIVPSRGGTIVFIVLGFEPVPTGFFFVAILKDNKNIKDNRISYSHADIKAYIIEMCTAMWT